MRLLQRLIPAILVALLSASFANAATTPNSFVTPQVPNIGTVSFISGTDSAGTYKTIYTGGANGSKCFAMMLNHDDQGAAHLVTWRIVHSTIGYDIGTYTTVSGSLPANTFGSSINLMSATNWSGLPLDASGNPYIYLTNGDTLRATFATSLTSADQINIITFCTDF
jgi:hypothetical protein